MEYENIKLTKQEINSRLFLSMTLGK